MPARKRKTDDASVIIRTLVRRRHKLHIGCEHLDDQLGFTRGYVSKLEKQHFSPTLFNLICWAQALGLHITIVEGRIPTDPLAELAYQRWLKTTNRLNTAKARNIFHGLIGLQRIGPPKKGPKRPNRKKSASTKAPDPLR